MLDPISRLPLGLAAFFGATGVMAGAFGAHALRDLVTPDRLAVWQTDAQYQLLHAVVLLALSIWIMVSPTTLGRWALRCFVVGIFLFSGSLYLLVLTDLRWFGAITPVGGVLLIVAWGMLLLGAMRKDTRID